LGGVALTCASARRRPRRCHVRVEELAVRIHVQQESAPTGRRSARSPAVEDRGDALTTDIPLPQRAFIAGVIDVLGDRTMVVRAEPGLHRGGRLLQIQATERRKARRMRSRESATECPPAEIGMD
jgi:hypothetical protein